MCSTGTMEILLRSVCFIGKAAGVGRVLMICGRSRIVANCRHTRLAWPLFGLSRRHGPIWVEPLAWPLFGLSRTSPKGDTTIDLGCELEVALGHGKDQLC